MVIIERILLSLAVTASTLVLSGCVHYQKDNGQTCEASLFPTDSIGAAMGMDNSYCTGRTADKTAEEAKQATDQASDWTDTALSELRFAKTAKASGWTDQVADSAASAKRAARTAREFSDSVKKLADWADYYAPKAAKTKDILGYANKANSLANTAENAAEEAALLSPK